jgi:hypothetical protein
MIWAEVKLKCTFILWRMTMQKSKVSVWWIHTETAETLPVLTCQETGIKKNITYNEGSLGTGYIEEPQYHATKIGMFQHVLHYLVWFQLLMYMLILRRKWDFTVLLRREITHCNYSVFRCNFHMRSEKETKNDRDLVSKKNDRDLT